jgi:hypothetical protein
MTCNRVERLNIAAPAFRGACIDDAVLTVLKALEQLIALNDVLKRRSDRKIPRRFFLRAEA